MIKVEIVTKNGMKKNQTEKEMKTKKTQKTRRKKANKNKYTYVEYLWV